MKSNQRGPLHFTSSLIQSNAAVDTFYWHNVTGYTAVTSSNYKKASSKSRYIMIVSTVTERELAKIMNHFGLCESLYIKSTIIFDNLQTQTFNLREIILTNTLDLNGVVRLFPNLVKCYMKNLDLKTDSNVEFEMLEYLSLIEGSIENVNQLILPKLRDLDIYSCNRTAEKLNHRVEKLRISSKAYTSVNYDLEYRMLQFFGLDKCDSHVKMDKVLNSPLLDDIIFAPDMVCPEEFNKLGATLIGVYATDDHINEFTKRHMTIYHSEENVLIQGDYAICNFDPFTLQSVPSNLIVRNEYVLPGTIKHRKIDIRDGVLNYWTSPIPITKLAEEINKITSRLTISYANIFIRGLKSIDVVTLENLTRIKCNVQYTSYIAG